MLYITGMCDIFFANRTISGKNELSSFQVKRLNSDQRLKQNQALGAEIANKAESGQYYFGLIAKPVEVVAKQLPTQQLDYYEFKNEGANVKRTQVQVGGSMYVC